MRLTRPHCSAILGCVVPFRLTTCAVLVATPVVLVGCGSAGTSAMSTRDASPRPSPSVAHGGPSPENRLIVPGRSLGAIRLREPRTSVEKVLGGGRPSRRGVVRYFGGRLLVFYFWHDRPSNQVEGLETTWGGFHTRSGVHVGSSRQELGDLHVDCRDGTCSRAAGRMPDAPGTVFTMRHGRVVQIDIFHS